MPHLTREQFTTKIGAIKLLALDVDGVLTDDGIYFGPDSFEIKRFDISDGLFMKLSMQAGLIVAVVSGRQSVATDSRMKDLGVTHVLQGKANKVGMITPLLEKLGVNFSEVAFVGNEILDIELATRVGLPIAVADACDDLKKVVQYITAKPGGNGAVREVIECWFIAKHLDPKSFLP
jgi:3-deoxy-D-manno-octulosonate 8-phosphate phosphatase (KDO 8-P phosphatase)